MNKDLIDISSAELLPEAVFSGGALDEIIDSIEREVRAIVTDPSTKAGRAEIASLAYKVARSKTHLDNLGKKLTADLKARTSAIDKSRRDMRARMDAIKADVRRPLTEFEERERKRIAEIESRIAEISRDPVSEKDLEARLAELRDMTFGQEWMEFSAKAETARNEAIDRISEKLRAIAQEKERAQQRIAARKRMEEERIEKARQEERERIEREQRERIEEKRKRKNWREIREGLIWYLIEEDIEPRIAENLVEKIAEGKVPHLAIVE